MKLLKQIEFVSLMLCIAALGCDARPQNPMTSIPKAQAQNDGQKNDRQKAGDAKSANTPANRPAPSGAGATIEPSNSFSKPAETAPGQTNNPSPNPSSNAADSLPNQLTNQLSSPSAKPSAPQAIEPVVDNSGNHNWLDADGSQLPMEYWEAQYFNAQRIGITHYKIEAERDRLKIRMETKMQIVRGNQPLRQSIVVETLEQLDGRLDQFTEILNAGAVTSRTDATITSNEMRLRSESAERTTRKQIEWPAGSWGPLGIHQMLLRKPMVPGEARLAKVFLPQLHQLAHVTMLAGKPENTTSPEGLLADVVPIDVLMQLEKDGIRVRMWADAQGRVQKTIWPEGLNLSSFRVSRGTAHRLQSEDEIGMYRDRFLACEAPDSSLPTAKQVQYLITSEQADPHNLFAQQPNQTVKPKPVYQTIVNVFRPEWTGADSNWPVQSAPSLKELSSSAWLPSDLPPIERLAKQWSGEASKPLDVAKSLLEATHQHVRKREFTPTVHSAEIVAQSLEGDCTEHAMLLAALLRNRQIPSRLASGVRLGQQDSNAKFEYHMWTEAWLNDCWIPMDATTGQLTNCAYLKFIDSSLADTDPYEVVLAVLRSLKPLKIDGTMGSK